MLRRISLIITLVIVFTFVYEPAFVFSNTTTSNKEEISKLNQEILQKKDKIKELEKNIEEYKKKIAAKQLEAVSLTNQMAIIDNRIAEVQLDIEKTNAKLEEITLEIEALALAIEDKETVLEKQKGMLAEFIRNIYQEGDKDLIEILTTYENFSDFYNQVQYVKTIEEDLGKNVRTVRLIKEDLDKQKGLTEERKDSYDAVKQELEEKRKNLDEQLYIKEDILLQTKSSEAEYKTLLSNLKSQYQQIEGDIASAERQVRQKLESQNKTPVAETNFDGKLSWPTGSRYVTAYFYDKDYPYRTVFEHNAIDIRAAQGTPVKAAGSGYIARAKRCSTASCYAYVMIVHSGGMSTVYGHLSSITVSEDKFVTRGDIIGYSGAMPGTVGAGPFTTGPHLHFEVRKNGIPVNPLSYLVKDY